MIRHVPTSGTDVAERLSVALWGLSRPAHVRGSVDTRRMFGALVATDGSVWQIVDTEFTIPVHDDAELGEIAGILQPWIDAGALPAGTLDELEMTIELFRYAGVRLPVWDAFPELFQQQSKTREQLVASGLLRGGVHG